MRKSSHIKNIHYNALFFDDGEDNKELLLLRKEKATYLEEVNKEVQRINEKFKSQKYTMSGDEIATIESNLSAESKKRDNNREVYPMLFDIDWKCDEHKAIYPEYFRYYYLLVNNNYYNLFKNTMIYSIKEVVVVYKQCKEEVENKKINQKEAETIKSMEDELLAKPEYKNYATNGEKRIKKLENKIHNAFPNALCLGHVTKIPENIFSYLFKIKIKNKIQALLMEKEFFINLFKEEELELVKEEKMDHKEREYHDNEENDNEQEIVHLYKLNSETDNKKFLKLLLLDEYKNIRNIDEMYEILNLLLSDYYNTERNKAHYLFSGPPGSGKTAMTVYMIQEYIKTIKHAELRKNLENETILFQVSQAFYTTEGKINNLFYSDVDKIVKQNENKNIIILFDEIDGFIKARNIEQDSSNSNIQSTLTLLDRSHNLPYSLIGTTNFEAIDDIKVSNSRYDDDDDYYRRIILTAQQKKNKVLGFIDPAVIRFGRFNHLLVPAVSESQVSQFLKNKLETNKKSIKCLHFIARTGIENQNKFIQSTLESLPHFMKKNQNLTIGSLANMIAETSH